MDEEAGVMGRLAAQPRSRSYSTGTMHPKPHRRKMAESNRIRARLEASTVGLGELLLLKQNQHRNIESVKAMFMSNLPLDDRMKSEKMFDININVPTVVVGKCVPPETGVMMMEGELEENRVSGSGESNDNQLEDSGYGESLQIPGEPAQRTRSVSMDVSVARSLALTAKKLVRMRSKEALSPNATTKTCLPAGRARGGRRRTNSHNDPTCETPDTQGTPRGDGKYKHTHKDSHNGSNSKMLKNLPSQRARGALQTDKYIDFSMDRSLSGSFLSLETSPKSFPSSPEYFNLPVNESMFDGHFKSPRSLSNSKLIFEFPSPMHAILLHFDKTEEPVLNENKLKGDPLSPKSKVSRYSHKRYVSDRRILNKSNTYHKCALRKDSTMGETAIDLSRIHSMHTNNSSEQKRLFADDGVSAFIEMLANRGLAKRRREEKEKEKLRIKNENNREQLGVERISSSNQHSEAKSELSERTSDLSDSSLKLSDDYMSSWVGSGLSSSGKRGSHVSVRSSASSKASLSSEEGYYSHPGSPKNKRDHEKCSLHSSVSTTSLGGSPPQSESTDMLDNDSLTIGESTGELTEKIENDKMEIITLPDSPGARRRKHNMDKPAEELTSSSDTLGVSKDATFLRCHSAPNSPNKTQRKGQSQFLFSTEPDAENTIEKRRNSADAVPVVTLTDMASPGAESRVPGMSNCLTDMKLAPNDGKNAAPSREVQAAPSGNNGNTWSKPGTVHDSTPMFQRVHCLESPRTPTIKEEPRKEALERGNGAKAHPLALKLAIPQDQGQGESELRSPPICQAPKVPSWRKRNKDQESKAVMKRTEIHIESAKGSPVTKNRDTLNHESKLSSVIGNNKAIQRDQQGVPTKVNTKSDKKSSPKQGPLRQNSGTPKPIKQNSDSDTVNKRLNSKENIPTSPPISTLTSGDGCMRESKVKNTHFSVPGWAESSKEGRENIFQYPTQTSKAIPVTPSTPTRRDIPEILKNWVESKTPALTEEQKVKQALHSKSFSLPVPMVLQPLTPTLSPRPNGSQQTEMSLSRSKRFFKSQEILPRDEKILGEKWTSTLERTPRGSPPKTVAHISFRNHKTSNTSGAKPLKANIVMANMKVETGGQNVAKTPVGNIPNTYDTMPRARSSSWSKGQSPSLPSKKNSWVREIVVPCNSPVSKGETTRPRSASFNLNTNKLDHQGSMGKSRMIWYQGRSEVNDTFV